MAILHIDGFDHYGTDTSRMTEGPYDQVDAAFTLSEANPRTGARCLRRDSSATDSYIAKDLVTDRLAVGTGAAFYLSGLPSNSDSYPIAEFLHGVTVQLAFIIQPDGSIDATVGGAVVASSEAGVVNSGEYVHIEFAAYTDSFEGSFSGLSISRKEQWKNIVEGESSENDYSDPDFDDSAWSTDPAPFWENGENPILQPLGWTISGGTEIAADSLVWMRREFHLSAPTTCKFTIAVDNYYNFYIDGILVSETESASSVGVFEFSVELSAGSHVLAAQVVDSAASTGPGNFFYADMEADGVSYGSIENGGIIEVRVNGVTVISKSDVLTTNSETKFYNSVRLPCGSSISHGVVTDIDDWYIWDDQGAWNNSFLGDRRCLLMKPNQDTNISDFDPSSGSFGYKMIDEDSPDDDSTYIIAEAYLQSGSPLSGTSEFEIENLPDGTSLISAVNVVTRASKTDSTSAEIFTSINSGADSLSQSAHALTTSYRYYSDLYEYDPATIASLTKDGLHSLSVSVTADDLDPGVSIDSPEDEIGSPTDNDPSIPTDFVARYLFDADFTDESGTYNGTNAGATFLTAGDGPGGSNFGINVGGGSKQVNLPVSLAAALGAGAGTISFAVRSSATTNVAIVLAGSDTATNNHSLLMEFGNGTNLFPRVVDIRSGSANFYNGDAAGAINTWHHVVIRTDGSTTSFRINGVNSGKVIAGGSDIGRWFGDVSSIDNMIIGFLDRAVSDTGAQAFDLAFLTTYARSISDAECEQLEAEW